MHGIKIRSFVLTFDLWLKIIPISLGLSNKDQEKRQNRNTSILMCHLCTSFGANSSQGRVVALNRKVALFSSIFCTLISIYSLLIFRIFLVYILVLSLCKYLSRLRGKTTICFASAKIHCYEKFMNSLALSKLMR